MEQPPRHPGLARTLATIRSVASTGAKAAVHSAIETSASGAFREAPPQLRVAVLGRLLKDGIAGAQQAAISVTAEARVGPDESAGSDERRERRDVQRLLDLHQDAEACPGWTSLRPASVLGRRQRRGLVSADSRAGEGGRQRGRAAMPADQCAAVPSTPPTSSG
jgi:hypothetical protein